MEEMCRTPEIKCEITDYPKTFLPGHTYQIIIESFQEQVWTFEDNIRLSKRDKQPIGLQVPWKLRSSRHVIMCYV